MNGERTDASAALVVTDERELPRRDLDDAMLDGLDVSRLAHRPKRPVRAGRNRLAHVVILALAACSTEWNVPPPPGLGEQYCEAYGLDCGHVYEFAAPAQNALGHVELCVLDEDLDAAAMTYGPAHPTSRFEGDNLCLWCCGEGCPAHGANALNGCWCGGGE